MIVLIDTAKTPMASMLKKVNGLDQLEHSWTADEYDAPNLTATVDGADVGASDHEDAQANRGELKGRCHYHSRVPKVSTLTESTSTGGTPAGRAMAQAIAKKMKELKRDMESVIGSSQESAADDGNDGNATRGLGAWLQTGAQTHLPVPAAFRPSAGHIDATPMASFNEETLDGVLQTIWNVRDSAESYHLFCGGVLKRTISNLSRADSITGSAVLARTFDGAVNKLETKVDIYQSDFGILNLHLDRHLGEDETTDKVIRMARRGYLVDLDLVELKYNIPLRSRDLPDTGGGPRKKLEQCFMLCVGDPRGLGKFAATA
ncbi:MAG: DUF5309 family protein [Verrucomicrobiota bacterium]